MKSIAILLVLAVAGCASVPDAKSASGITPEQMQACEDQRGCILISRQRAVEIMSKAVMEEVESRCSDMKHSESLNLKGQL